METVDKLITGLVTAMLAATIVVVVMTTMLAINVWSPTTTTKVLTAGFNETVTFVGHYKFQGIGCSAVAIAIAADHEWQKELNPHDIMEQTCDANTGIDCSAYGRYMHDVADYVAQSSGQKLIPSSATSISQLVAEMDRHSSNTAVVVPHLGPSNHAVALTIGTDGTISIEDAYFAFSNANMPIYNDLRIWASQRNPALKERPRHQGENVFYHYILA